MAKLELILLDDDLDYGHGLREFLRAGDASGTSVRQYTKQEAALEAVKAAGGGAVLLVGEGYWPLAGAEKVIAVLLLESLTDTGRLPAGVPFAFKYAPLEQVLRAAENALRIGSSASPRLPASHGTRIVSWFSAAGGSGKRRRRTIWLLSWQGAAKKYASSARSVAVETVAAAGRPRTRYGGMALLCQNETARRRRACSGFAAGGR
ncbi:hypothetical protein SD70_15165 [Gordoniibacillus kamchatkensis]|uniref:Response regulatory domain-containing protein n=1 Tax=Gordoniibacillus kamchatkensis TaxID=1590651 RepID=A0ABR5AGL1_9BACL|nr:hypothetical protein [Paenibacillus sp. VKM B-2647]KIL40166.1 hypothetical protein SD70_15165 [Paenibacillus sp. VKM B-2647]